MDFVSSEKQKFQRCINKLMNAGWRQYDIERETVNSVLDDLNSIDYINFGLVRQDLSPTFCHTTRLIPPEDALLMTKFCQWIVSVTHCKDVKLDDDAIDTLMQFLLRFFQQCPDWTQSEFLRALGAVLYDNGPRCIQYIDDLLSTSSKKPGLLMQLITSSNPETKRAAIQCMGNLCMKTESGHAIDETYLKLCFQQILQFLHQPKEANQDDLTYLRLVWASLKSLASVLGSSKSVYIEDLGRVLAALKSYMLLGLPGFVIASPSESSLYPSPFQYELSPLQSTAQGRSDITTVQGTPTSSGAGKRSKRKGKRTKQSELSSSEVTPEPTNQPQSDTASLLSSYSPESQDLPWSPSGRISSSESEYSDTEGGQANRLKSLATKVRQASLGCLHVVFKTTEKRLIFGYWSAFVPDSPLSSSGPHIPPNLFTSILKDSNTKCRAGSVMVLCSLLDGAKQFLASAEDSADTRAFTPFSQTLASTIKEIHRCLQLALVAESYGTNITHIIKCISILVTNVPYHKLKPGLLTKVVRAIRPFYQHKDNRVRTACLTCLGAVLITCAPLQEVTEIFSDARIPLVSGSTTLFTKLTSDMNSLALNSPSGEEREQSIETRLAPSFTQEVAAAAEVGTMSWLLKWCSDVILEIVTSGDEVSSPAEVLPVRLEALQVLTLMTKHYFSLVRSHLDHMVNIIKSCLSSTDEQVRLHGLKVLEEFGKSMLSHVDSKRDVDKALTVPETVGVWDSILKGSLPSVLQDFDNTILQASACECLATIGPHTCLLLESRQRIMVMTILLGLVNEEDYRLKMAAVRTLGVIVQYPCLREDVIFVADTANAILNCIQHTSINVRMRAAWSLGNLCDALLSNVQSGNEMFLDEISELLLQRLLEAAITGSTDHDKVKSNSVRALGLLGRVLGKQTLGKASFKGLINKAIQGLMKNITSGAMKIRWNSCYALGNIFRNPSLPVNSGAWPEDIFNTLTQLLVGCKNFKVRINAALALSLIEQRNGYGSTSSMYKIWTSLLRALELIDEVAEVSELKYRDTLREQLCQTIVHLASLLTADDAFRIFLDPEVIQKHPVFLLNMKKYMNKLETKTEVTTRSGEDNQMQNFEEEINKAYQVLQRANDNIRLITADCPNTKLQDLQLDLSQAFQLEAELVRSSIT